MSKDSDERDELLDYVLEVDRSQFLFRPRMRPPTNLILQVDESKIRPGLEREIDEDLERDRRRAFVISELVLVVPPEPRPRCGP